MSLESSKPKLCLNMIVKNEGEIIAKTLYNLLKHLPIDYWVISDTGSTDNTIEEIKRFFNEKNINGEIFRDEWKDFAFNRTLALNYAYNKSDYLCIFDADDKIIGNLKLPDILDKDSYNLGFGHENGISYVRPLIINNKKKWEFKGVLHEYLSCLDQFNGSENIVGEYFIRHNALVGDRTKIAQKEKYMKDALILEKAYKESLEKNDKIYERYAFYCGNSYRDCQEYSEAIKWYKIVLTHNNWDQEKYISCLRIFECYRELNEKESGFFYLVESYKYDNTRVECIYELIVHYSINNMHKIAYNYFQLVENLYDNNDNNDNNDNSIFTNGKLFLDISKATFYLPYQLSICCCYVNKNNVAIKMYKIIFRNKYKEFNEFFVKHIFFNLQFYIEKIESTDTEFFILYKEYLDFLIQNNYPIQNHIEFIYKYEKYGLYVPKILQTKEINKNSNKILFFIGYSYEPWNYTYSLTNALGGSEKAVIYLSQQFPKNYEIYISGSVKEETIDNIRYVNLKNLPKLIETTSFHTIIVSRYISFFENYSYFSSYQTYIWAHDTCLPNYGCNNSQNDILKKWSDKINGCICQTEWHKDLFNNIYPELLGKINNINNGIKLEYFKYELKKVKNRFIYTSRSERGLDKLIELWPKIINNLPNAELYIASYNLFPSNDYENNLYKIMKNYDNIHHVGKLNNEKLYELMSSAEYWLYPTCWPETSCITAMEMLANKVICIYYPVAGLVNTLGDYGLPVEKGNEIQTIIELTNERKHEIRETGYTYALSCCWENRYNKWSNILFKNVDKIIDYNNKFIKVINLKRRTDRKNDMIKKLKYVNIDENYYEIFEAVDGKELKPTMYIKKLFEGNYFNYRKGILGCSLSHINLWKKLLNDTNNNFYVIIEDDVTFVDNFIEKLEKSIKIFLDNNYDHALLGLYAINNKNIDINNINFNICNDEYIGTYGYIISKSGCKKILDNIKINSIKYPIDHYTIYNRCFNTYIINEYIIYAESFQQHNNTDTDIQLSDDSLEFSNIDEA